MSQNSNLFGLRKLDCERKLEENDYYAGSYSFSYLIPANFILNSNQRYHFQKKASITRELRYLASLGGHPKGLKFEKCKILVFVMPPTKRRMDPPNYYPTVKALVDGLTDCGLWDDDDYKHIEELSFRYGGTSGVSKHYRIDFFIKPMKEVEEELEKDLSLS